jgi:hypothetical protein
MNHKFQVGDIVYRWQSETNQIAVTPHVITNVTDAGASARRVSSDNVRNLRRVDDPELRASLAEMSVPLLRPEYIQAGLTFGAADSLWHPSALSAAKAGARAAEQRALFAQGMAARWRDFVEQVATSEGSQ